MAAVPRVAGNLSPDEYLALERAAEFKSEYFAGEMFAMAGASPDHSRITLNLAGEFRSRLRGRRCEAFSNDTKVLVSPSGLFTYPDLSVVCDPPRFHDLHRDALLNPTLIVEVLSPSTEACDRGKKFENYRQLESLRGYLLIAQEEPHVELFERGDDGVWRLYQAKGLDSEVTIGCVEVSLPLKEIYERVRFGGGERSAVDGG